VVQRHDLRYGDGEAFYSPSAFAKLLRHSRTGRLYCFLNICPVPPNGNSPRYPLYMAEVDEALPALRRESLVLIDTREGGDTEQLHLSNFSVLENRETGTIELYLTRLGENADSLWSANAYRYTIPMDAG